MAPLFTSSTTNMALQDSSITTSLEIEDFTTIKPFYEDITVLPALRKCTFERQDSALQKILGQTALPAFHMIIYTNFCRN
jgi:hypothetical protein